MTAFGSNKIDAQKIKKQFFSKFYSLTAHAHYFTVLTHLATWRATKLDIFTHFTSINLSQCSQSINSLMDVYYTDPQLLFMSTWSQLWSHFFVLPLHILGKMWESFDQKSYKLILIPHVVNCWQQNGWLCSFEILASPFLGIERKCLPKISFSKNNFQIISCK